MSADPVAELLAEIAAKHGVAVSRDDPILILQTINARLLRDGQAAQVEALEQFKSELEAIATRWSADAKTKSERILNASLTASKEAMHREMQEGAKSMTAGMRAEIAAAHRELQGPVEAAHRVAMINLSASLVTAAAVLVAVVVWVMH